MTGQHISHVGRIDGVRIDNIQIRHAGSMGCSITGLPGHPVRNVSVSNVVLHHKGGVKQEQLAETSSCEACDKMGRPMPFLG